MRRYMAVTRTYNGSSASDSRFTTLEAELRRMKAVADDRVSNFLNRTRRTFDQVDTIFHVFKSSSRVTIAPKELIDLRTVIERTVQLGNPVAVSFLWAFSWMSQSPWKFVQAHLIHPRLCDYWAAFW